MADFVPGLTLNAGFYTDVVEPLVRPWPHAAALLGWGSDVLGYDTARSTDHGWGPRLLVFTTDEDVAPVSAAVEDGLPAWYLGRPVRYGWDDVPVRHQVTVTTLSAWLVERLGFDPRDGLQPLDWLCLPQQQLLGVVAGRVYADCDGALTAVRTQLQWYPDQVWRWLLACQWRRLDQEEPFVGRTAEVGDELGSAVLAARLARDVMRLALLLERRYAPYAKWLGTAFAELPIAATLGPQLRAATSARDHPAREDALVAAYELVAARHNEVLPAFAADPTARPFYTRPFRVLGADRFAQACLGGVTDPVLAALPLVGGIDQFSDSTDVLEDVRVFAEARQWLDAVRARR